MTQLYLPELDQHEAQCLLQFLQSIDFIKMKSDVLDGVTSDNIKHKLKSCIEAADRAYKLNRNEMVNAAFKKLLIGEVETYMVNASKFYKEIFKNKMVLTEQNVATKMIIHHTEFIF